MIGALLSSARAGTLHRAGKAALVAFALGLPLVYFETVDLPGGGLGLHFHPLRLAILTGTAFILASLAGWVDHHRQGGDPRWPPTGRGRAGRGRAGRGEAGRLALILTRVSRPAGLLALILAFVLPFLPFTSRYLVDLATTVLIYVMLGWGLNIVVGLAGLLDLGYVAFYAVGAYSLALLSRDLGLGFWQALPLSGLTAACFGILLGFPVLRLRGDYLAIVTLGFGEIIRIILTNWVSLTGGPNGIGGIPRPSFFGLPLERNAPPGTTTFSQFFHISFQPEHRVWFLYFVILGLALITNFFTLRVRRLPIGRAWEALREDEIACRALGINPTNVKLSAFALGAMFGGFAGCFFGARQGFISPESFTFMQSAIILAIVVLGGMGSQLGVVLAALLLTCLPELGRQLGNLQILGHDLADYRMLLFGAAMVVIMIWRPGGLLAHRRPTVRLNGAPDPVKSPDLAGRPA